MDAGALYAAVGEISTPHTTHPYNKTDRTYTSNNTKRVAPCLHPCCRRKVRKAAIAALARRATPSVIVRQDTY